MRAEMIELLTTKGRFQTEQAVILAEAIDMSIRDAQPVTVPILNARFAEFESRFTAFEAKMEGRLTAFESKIEGRLAAFESKMDGKFAAFESKIDGRLSGIEAKMDQKIDRLRLQFITAIVIGGAAMGPLGSAAVDVLKRVF